RTGQGKSGCQSKINSCSDGSNIASLRNFLKKNSGKYFEKVRFGHHDPKDWNFAPASRSRILEAFAGKARLLRSWE
ncbi:MAG: hypothetical protein WBN22_11285, partial [Verrucomicrobiia bacterium]